MSAITYKNKNKKVECHLLIFCSNFNVQGTQAQEKNELLIKEFNIDYNELETMFRRGSLAFWEKVIFISLSAYILSMELLLDSLELVPVLQNVWVTTWQTL
jgi:hypothetical protein